MSTDLKQQLFAKLTKAVLLPVTVNEVDCFVRQWTERERLEYSGMIKDFQNGDELASSELASRTIAMSLADAHGNLIFSQDDLATIRELPTLEFQKLFDFIVESQTKKAVDAKKNSETTQSLSSTSSSPAS
jgi:hypothetical protein